MTVTTVQLNCSRKQFSRTSPIVGLAPLSVARPQTCHRKRFHSFMLKAILEYSRAATVVSVVAQEFHLQCFILLEKITYKLLTSLLKILFFKNNPFVFDCFNFFTSFVFLTYQQCHDTDLKKKNQIFYRNLFV